MLRHFSQLPRLVQKRCFAAAAAKLAVGDTVTYTDPKAVFHKFIYNHKDCNRNMNQGTYSENVAAWAKENQVGMVTNVDEKTGQLTVDFGHEGTYVTGVINNCDPKMLSKNITSFYDVKMKTSDGKNFDMEQTKGKVVVCTNIEDAQCVKDLEWQKLGQLYKRFKSRKESDQIIFLLFPNFKFDKSEAWVSEKLGVKFGDGFHLMEKNDINGNDTQSAYKFLKALHPGRIDWRQNEIHGVTMIWGSDQFVVGRDGRVAKKLGAGAFQNLWLACEGQIADVESFSTRRANNQKSFGWGYSGAKR